MKEAMNYALMDFEYWVKEGIREREWSGPVGTAASRP